MIKATAFVITSLSSFVSLFLSARCPYRIGAVRKQNPTKCRLLHSRAIKAVGSSPGIPRSLPAIRFSSCHHSQCRETVTFSAFAHPSLVAFAQSVTEALLRSAASGGGTSHNLRVPLGDTATPPPIARLVLRRFVQRDDSCCTKIDR
jgi:hypothetical protein